MSSRNGDKARLNKQQRRRRVRRAELSAAHKLALKNKKAINLEPETEVEPHAVARDK